MKTFLDTSVLIAIFYDEHKHHEPSFELFLRQRKPTAFTAVHCLEIYSVVTRMPGKDRASPDEAMLFISDVRERLTTVALNEEEYIEMLDRALSMDIRGGAIYDFVAGCALKAKAQTIYTWNLKHFNRLGPDVASRVMKP